MKKIFLALASIAIGLVSCTKDNVEPQNTIDESKTYPVSFVIGNNNETKSLFEDDGSIKFKEGDKFGVYVYSGTTVIQDNRPFEFVSQESGGVTISGNFGVYGSNVSGAKIVVYYPYSADGQLSIPATQGVKQLSDFITISGTYNYNETTPEEFGLSSATWNHYFAFVRYVVSYTGTKYADDVLKSITIQTAKADMVCSFTYNFRLQTMGSTFTNKSNSMVLNFDNGDVKLSDLSTATKYFGVVNPVTPAPAPIKIIVETKNGHQWTFDKATYPTAANTVKGYTLTLTDDVAETVSTIAEIKDGGASLESFDESDSTYNLNPVTVIYQKTTDKTYTFVKDATGYAVIYQQDMTGQPKYYPGDVINGFKVKAKNYHNWFELTPQSDYPQKVSTTTIPTPESVTSIAALDYDYGTSSDQSRYVEMENAEITKSGSDYFADGIQLYTTPTNGAVDLSTLNDGDKVTIAGFPLIRDAIKYFSPISFTVTAAVDAVSADPTTLSWAGDETDAKTVTVTSSGAWTATIDNTADFTLSATSGVNGGTFTVTPTGTNDGSSAKTATVTLTLGTATATVACAQAVAGAATEYVFGQHADFATWGSSYTNHSLTYTDITANFTEYNRQTGTITDCPVTKGKEMVVILNDNSKSIGSVSFVLKQWTTKVQTVELLYSTDGTNYTTTGVTSSTFSIPTTTLPANTIAVKLKFNKTNQVGVYSCSMTIN